jgi:hypothetical protein
MNKPILLGYQRKRNDNLANVNLNLPYDVKFTNVVYGILIRSMVKSIMMRYFDYWDKSGIQISYYNTDSILRKETDIELMKQFISDQ